LLLEGAGYPRFSTLKGGRRFPVSRCQVKEELEKKDVTIKKHEASPMH